MVTVCLHCLALVAWLCVFVVGFIMWCTYLLCRVWDVSSGQMLNTLVHHCEAVLHLRFNNNTMVTCSKVLPLIPSSTLPSTPPPPISPHPSYPLLQDRTIAVWDMKSPKDIVLRRVLVGHRAAVNVVDFDDRYIVSASGDRTIKVSTVLCIVGMMYYTVQVGCQENPLMQAT